MIGAPLIGRDRELTALAQMLADPGVRLVTVTGPGGVGKTRVAHAVADAVAADGARRVVRVDLAPLGDAGLVADSIAAAAGATSAGPALHAAAGALGDRPALLVLDNFEHVGAAAGDVVALLDACPRMDALVTSRHVVGLAAEHLFPLAPLTLPEPGEADPVRAGRCAAVALFAARARARDPAFALTPDVTADVTEICRRVDGLPLAIELAAARIAVLPPRAMLAHWPATVGLDVPGAHDLPPRQRTLRQAFAWSYDLLDEADRALLRRLAAFPGGFGLPAVQAACRGGEDGVLPDLGLEPIAALGRLVDRSLVAREDAGEPRYTLLVTVRAFLREQLTAHGEDAAADLLMASTCVAIARQAGQFLAGSRSREQLDLLDRELNNVRAALPILLRAAPEQALGLVVDLTGLWETRRVREGREWLGRALGAGGTELDGDQRAWGLLTAALLAFYQGDTEAARDLARAALAAASEGGAPLTLARALYIDALGEGDTALAAERYRESLALCERLGDDAGVAMASNDLAEIARAAGDLDAAAALYERALALWRTLDDASGVARAAHNLGQTMRAAGDLDGARSLFRDALRASEALGDRTGEAAGLAGLVAVAAAEGPSAAVATLFGAAVAELEGADIVLEPIDEEPFRAAETTLLAALGRERFDAAAARGRRMDGDARRALAERITTRADAPPPDALTRREQEVVGMLADGLTNGEIAERLVLSEHTVHRHVANILGKLGVPSRAAAVSAAARRGLL